MIGSQIEKLFLAGEQLSRGGRAVVHLHGDHHRRRPALRPGARHGGAPSMTVTAAPPTPRRPARDPRSRRRAAPARAAAAQVPLTAARHLGVPGVRVAVRADHRDRVFSFNKPTRQVQHHLERVHLDNWKHPFGKAGLHRRAGHEPQDRGRRVRGRHRPGRPHGPRPVPLPVPRQGPGEHPPGAAPHHARDRHGLVAVHPVLRPEPRLRLRHGGHRPHPVLRQLRGAHRARPGSEASTGRSRTRRWTSGRRRGARSARSRSR